MVLPYVLQQSRGCLSCCIKPPLITAVDEPSKGLRIQGQKVKKPRKSEDFWSTSTLEMDNSTVQSQKSISSISISNQPVDPTSSTGGTSNSSEFVNNGKSNFLAHFLRSLSVYLFRNHGGGVMPYTSVVTSLQFLYPWGRT